MRMKRREDDRRENDITTATATDRSRVSRLLRYTSAATTTFHGITHIRKLKSKRYGPAAITKSPTMMTFVVFMLLCMSRVCLMLICHLYK